jgi:hypothetical protein
MSKNTNIAELINYISVDGSGNVVLSTGQIVATQNYVTTAISNLVASAPSTLDTLNELATALGNDANFATTVATSIGTKQPQLNGTGFVKVTGTTVSYDNSTYLTSASLTGYIPYTGATGNVTLGNYELGAKYVIAEGSAGLGGVISIKQDAAYLAKGNGYSSIASSFTEFDFFGYTGASTYKNFTLKFDGLTNNTRRRYTLPDADGTLALTSNLSSYLPLAGGTLTGPLGGTSATFSDIITSTKTTGRSFGNDSYTTNFGWISMYGTTQGIQLGFEGTTGGQLITGAPANYGILVGKAGLAISANNGGANHLNITSTGAVTFSSSITAESGYFNKPTATNGTSLIVRQTTAGGNGNQDIGLLVDIQGANDLDRILNLRYYDGTTYTSRFAVRRNGTVGINTTTFSEYLNIGNAGAIAWQNTSNVQKWHLQYNVSNDGLNFVESSVADYRLFLKAGGRIGINTATPAGTLDVQSSGANGIILSADSSDTNNSGRLFFMRTGGEGFVIMNNAGNLSFRSNSIPGNTSGNERMKLDSSYNLILNAGLTVATTATFNTAKINVGGTGASYLYFHDTSTYKYLAYYVDDTYWRVPGIHYFEGTSGFKGYWDASGNLLPGVDASYNLGSISKRWNNVYTTDLHLSNKGKQNIVDGTWGDWTLQEGENDIFMLNNRSGEKFKIQLEKI